jgi:hypothetical protein
VFHSGKLDSAAVIEERDSLIFFSSEKFYPISAGQLVIRQTFSKKKNNQMG